MASDPVSILLVPHDGDPHGLLREGPCGARPPFAWKQAGRVRGRVVRLGGWRPGGDLGCAAPRPGDALVLAWKGEVSQEGCDRASYACDFRWREGVEEWVLHMLCGFTSDAAMWSGFGEIVTVDADGREVEP